MTTMELILGNQSAQLAGWTLLHFVWQGGFIALLPFIVRALSTRQSARLRYGTACLALLMMAVSPLITFSVLEGRSNPSSGLRLNSESLLEKLSSGNWNSATSLELFSPSWLQTIEPVVSPWLPWLTVAWLCGVLFLSLRLAGGLFYTQRLTRNRTRPIGTEWQEKLRRLCQQLQVRQTVLLLESARIQVPTVIGWLRPVILLPASALTGLTTPQLEAILAHELAHIRRHDYLVNLLQTAVETLLFYHPAVWWVSKQVRLEREHCCDDLAVAVQGDVLTYARALAELETRRTNEPQLAMAANGGSLLTRIERLLVGSQPRKAPQGLWLTGVMVVASLVGVAAGTRSDVFFGAGGAVLSEVAENVEITQALTEPLIEPDLLPRRNSAPSQEDRPTRLSEPVATLGVDQRTETEAVARVEVRVTSGDAYAYLQNTNTNETKRIRSADNASGQQASAPTKGDYIGELRRLGYTNLSVDQLIELKSHGVSIEFIEGLKREGLTELSVGFPRLPLEALVKARQHGVTPAFIKDLQSLGYAQLSLDDVIKARMHGIDSNFIRELQSAGHKGLSLGELVRARQHGVDADFAKTLEPLGYSGLSLEQLIKLRNHGVNSEFIRAIRQEGYDKVSIDDLIRLRSHGVNAEFIQRMKSQGFRNLSLDQLIKMRTAGL